MCLVEDIFKIIEKEGNYKEFKHKGYKCVIIRHPKMLHLCGYVGVPKGHILYGIDYEDAPSSFHIVHGGLTFSGHLKATNDDLWYFGFDCAHYGDCIPGLSIEGEYKTMEYVKNECKKLAEEIDKFTKLVNEVIDVVAKSPKLALRIIELITRDVYEG